MHAPKVVYATFVSHFLLPFHLFPPQRHPYTHNTHIHPTTHTHSITRRTTTHTVAPCSIPITGQVEEDFPESEVIRRAKKQQKLLKQAGKTVQEVLDAVEEEAVEQAESEASSEVNSLGDDDYDRIVTEDEERREEKDQLAYECYVEAYLKDTHDPHNAMPIDRTQNLGKNLEAVMEFL